MLQVGYKANLVVTINNLAKIGDGLDESPTVMVGDKTTKQNN